jgi:hypothetical protein
MMFPRLYDSDHTHLSMCNVETPMEKATASSLDAVEITYQRQTIFFRE